MSIYDLASSVPGWLDHAGPDADIVISSRARMARNLKGFLYAHRADDSDLDEIVGDVLDVMEGAGFDPDTFYRNSVLTKAERTLFLERHLTSANLSALEGNRGVVFKDGELTSIMVNEEDHLRIQSMRGGLDLETALEDARGVESALSKSLAFSYSDDYGYLTACPTNFGTGLRLSVLVHLPALVLTKEIQKVARSAGQLGMLVRGYRGEGSDVIGNLFQISNQSSFGKSEEEILGDISKVAGRIVEYEKNAANVLLDEAAPQIGDKIWRSTGILRTARVLSTREFLNLSSAVRLGVFLGILEKPGMDVLNELMIMVQPEHLQERLGRRIESSERDMVRADMVRERLVDLEL